MRRISINIPIYDWELTIVTVYDKGCKESLKNLIDEFKLPEGEELLGLLDEGSFNGGRTYAKKGMRKMVVILFPWKTENDFVRILNHEKRHIIDNIVEWHDLEGDEAPAYLDGYISEQIFKQIDKLK